MPLASNIETTLQRHGYSTLPAVLENTRLAVFHHESNGTACADVLAYREINGRGETLKDEAALLVEALPRIGQQLSRQPDLLSPDSQAHDVAFLGRKAHLLVGSDGRPLRCRLFPLLILSPTIGFKAATDCSVTSLPVVSANQLDQYIARQRSATSPQCSAIDAWLLHFRRSHQLLGAALIAFPSLLGLALLLVSFGWLSVGILDFMVAALCPLALLFAALRHFRAFEKENPSGVLINPEPPSLAPERSTDSCAVQVTTPLGSVLASDEEETAAPWTPANTAAFLLDSMQSAMSACLSTYQAANWRAYAGYLSSLLINGVRLAILKRTGRVPPQRIEETLDQLPSTNVRGEVAAWLRRLTTARQSQPLATGEAQQAAHFVAQLLRQLHVIPATWTVQIFRVIPQLPTSQLTGDNSGGMALTNAAVPTNPLSQGSRLLQPTDAMMSPPIASYERRTTASVSMSESVQHPNFSPPATMTPDSSSAMQGAPLNILSERDLDLLADMVRAGASPYLFVFGNRYLAHWKPLRQMVDQAAQELNSQVNVIVFPGLGDQKVDSKVEAFYHRFRVEGASAPSSLPFICALSRAVLLHVLEDNLPVPSELVVNPRTEEFVSRVRMMIPTAQAYQVNLNQLASDNDSDTEPPQPDEHHDAKGSASQLIVSSSATGTGDLAVHPVSPGQPAQSLVASTDDVVEEVDSAHVPPQSHRVTEVDVTAALQRRELATMVPVALAVVHLPEHQQVLDALETAVQQEEYLVAEYVDSARYPNASEALRTDAGTIRLRYNGCEQLLEVPEADHLVASIRQLRTAKETESTKDESKEVKAAVRALTRRRCPDEQRGPEPANDAAQQKPVRPPDLEDSP
jgi:hypothetical protein